MIEPAARVQIRVSTEFRQDENRRRVAQHIVSADRIHELTDRRIVAAHDLLIGIERSVGDIRILEHDSDELRLEHGKQIAREQKSLRVRSAGAAQIRRAATNELGENVILDPRTVLERGILSPAEDTSQCIDACLLLFVDTARRSPSVVRPA